MSERIPHPISLLSENDEDTLEQSTPSVSQRHKSSSEDGNNKEHTEPQQYMPVQSQELQGDSSFAYGKYLTATSSYGLLTMVVFLVSLCYMFAATFRMNARGHNFKILFVDYDNDGAISRSIHAAYQELKGPQFPEVINGTATSHPNVASLVHSVRDQDFWAAVYVLRGASSSFATAITESNASFNSTQAMGYVWNEIRYSSMSTSLIKPSIISLFAAAQTSLDNSSQARELLSSAIARNLTQTALNAYLSPFQPMESNLWAAPQWSKVFYNTVVIAMCFVETNAFLLASTQIAKKFELHSRTSYAASMATLFGVSACFTLLAALKSTGVIWAFREDWRVDAGQFFETWMVFWLLMHITYLSLNVVLSLIGLTFYALVFLIIVLVCVTGTIFPMESSPGFFRWGQALPTYSAWRVLEDIWSNSHSKLYQYLPVLFAWWLVMLALAALSLSRKFNKG